MLKVEVTKELIERLNENKISTTSDFDMYNSKNGWISDFKTLEINNAICIEGPCAFYCSPANKSDVWKADGGICSMGAYSYSHSYVPSGLKVGRYCSIAKNLKVLDFSHPITWLSSSVAFFKPQNIEKLTSIHYLIDEDIQYSKFKREAFDPTLGKAYPIIGNDVWIGENVSLSMGIEIGNGSIIAANSTVTKNVEPYAIVAGVPAKKIKSRFNTETVTRLLVSRWWEYDIGTLDDLDYTNILDFLDEFEKRKSSLKTFSPKKLTINGSAKDVL